MKKTSHRSTRREFLAGATAAVLGGVVGPRSVAGSTVAGLPYFDEKGWQIGCWSRPWSKFDYRVGFDAIAEAGFKYVGLTGAKTKTRRVIATATTLEDSAKVGEEARKRGLKIVTAYGGGIPLDSDEALRKMIDNAAAAGAWSVLLAHVGKPDNFDVACQTVARCCDHAAEKKMAIVLKPHGGTTGTGPELRKAIEKIGGYDLILTGQRALDTGASQMGPRLAEYLGLPQVLEVRQVSGLDNGKLMAKRNWKDGLAEIEVGLPALLSIAPQANQPRLPHGARIMSAYREWEVAAWGLADLGLTEEELSPLIGLQREAFPPERTLGELITGTPDEAAKELAQILKTRS